MLSIKTYSCRKNIILHLSSFTPKFTHTTICSLHIKHFWIYFQKNIINGPFYAKSVQKTDLKIKASFKFACWRAEVSTHHSLQPRLLFSHFVFWDQETEGRPIMTRMMLSKKLCCGLKYIFPLAGSLTWSEPSAVQQSHAPRLSQVLLCSLLRGWPGHSPGDGWQPLAACISYHTPHLGDNMNHFREFSSPLFFLGWSIYSCLGKNMVLKLQPKKKKK